MKTILIFLITSLFIGCENPKPQAYPQWYKHRELQSTVKYEVIGYGQGDTIKEAKTNAKEDISQTLISKIDSSFTSQTITHNDNFNERTKSNLKITSKVSLHNLKTIKQEQLNGVFYIALKYKNLDLAYRIKTTIGSLQCNKNQYNNYLSRTPLIKELTASIGCKLDFKLDRRNQAWYLKYNEHLFLLSDDEFEELYVSKINDKFEFTSSKIVLTDGDSFHFALNSKREGYVTLLNVYENGTVTLLQPSILIKNSIQVPSIDSENYFEAGLVTEGVNTYDLYVAIYTKKPLDMSRFEYANEDLAESELAYKFDELINLIDTYEYSSMLMRTLVK